MQANPKAGTLGYISNFIEIFAWVTTIDAYESLWELLWPTINPYGWGYDFWYDGYSWLKGKYHNGTQHELLLNFVNELMQR
jgi:hypothetical protein